MDEVVQEFLTESAENLDRLDWEFVELEQDPSRLDLLASIFRTIHTIKGTCGFLGFGNLERVAHAGETLLSRLRDGARAHDRASADGLLSMVDAVRKMLAAIEATGADGDDRFEALVARLLATADTPASADVAAPPPADHEEPTPAAPAPEPESDEPAEELDAPQSRADSPVPQPGSNAPSIADQSIRVDVGVLEKLMNLVGELVLARNQLLQHTAAREDTALHQVYQRIDLITSQLQDGTMKTRMQPVGSAWSKLPRLCRDVSATCGKRVRLVMEGQETEVDRTLLDAIRDPLTHIVRNAVDHGIERPEVRVAAGKPAEGTVHLRAWHEGGQVHIEIADDGGGLRNERILAKAIERGLVTASAAARMSPREITDLIFEPGFSTADAVTAVSGRGVGMDVVRTDISAVNGVVDVTSTEGQGTVLRIRIPLTLAIIPALLVTCAGESFAVPQVSVIQLLKFDEERPDQTELLHETRVFRYHGDLLPLLLLDEELGLRSAGRSTNVGVLVLQAGDRRFGVAVDRVGDSAEIVVKPLTRTLKALGVYAGATIAGDGRVALILDVAGLARRAHLVVESGTHSAAQADAAGEATQSYLLVKTVDDGRAAIPLEAVSRLEEVGANEVQRVGTSEVVRCRGRILPLVRLSAVLTERRVRPRRTTLSSELGDRLSIVVHERPEGAVGIVPEDILEIVETVFVDHRPAVRAGVLFSATINDRVTEILDLVWLSSRAEADLEGTEVGVG